MGPCTPPLRGRKTLQIWINSSGGLRIGVDVAIGRSSDPREPQQSEFGSGSQRRKDIYCQYICLRTSNHENCQALQERR